MVLNRQLAGNLSVVTTARCFDIATWVAIYEFQGLTLDEHLSSAGLRQHSVRQYNGTGSASLERSAKRLVFPSGPCPFYTNFTEDSEPGI